MAMHLARFPVLLLVLGGCLASKPASIGLASKPASVAQPVQREPQTGFRLKLCREQPLRLQAGPGAPQTRGCVVTFTQPVSDPATLEWAKTASAERRYVVYAPANLPSRPAPVVFVFPGATCNAEAAAVYNTHARFEQLADRDGFVVVYGNGLPTAAHSGNDAPMPKGGFLPGCWADHTGEGLDVTYVRLIVAQLAEELAIDRTRIYATGMSQGGGMSFQLALEAPDLVAAIAPVVSVPFQPKGEWLRSCHPKPGFDRVSIAMVAATADPFIPYAPGSSVEVPEAHFVGMEATRDAWLAALHLEGAPMMDSFPDQVKDDSYQPRSGTASSTMERQRYPVGPDGQELWYYKAEGMGHAWPNPVQVWSGLWKKFGKTNQDVDFADQAWAFFQRHSKHP